MTCSRTGWSMPVRERYAEYSGSSTTTASGRFSNARIIAVEMLRGPDHMATRGRRSWRGDVGVDEPAIQLLEALDHGAAAPVADDTPVHRADRHDSGERPGDERLARGGDVGEAERRLARRDPVRAADLEHVRAGDAGQAVAAVGGQHLGCVVAAGDDEEVRRVAGRDEPVRVEH